MAAILIPGSYLSIAIYILSLLLPAFDTREVLGQVNTSMGWEIAATGPVAVLYGNVAWLANGALACAWLLAFLKKAAPCLYLSTGAFVLSLDVFRFNSQRITDKAYSCCVTIDKLHIGYYVWLTSILIMMIAALVAIVRSKRGQHQF